MGGSKDWFENMFGFRERGYEETQAMFIVEGTRLRSRANGAEFEVGTYRTVALAELRDETRRPGDGRAALRLSAVRGDVRGIYRSSQGKGALFQVASQFNMLEMVSPDVTPEDGISRYASDPTQGPASALCAAAGTVYRNYFVEVGGRRGQTSSMQVDGSAGLRAAMAKLAGTRPEELWTNENGYAHCSTAGLRMLREVLEGIGPSERDSLAGMLCIGLHSGVEVTPGPAGGGAIASQAFCSALPVSYYPGSGPREAWEPFARFILEAAYEATLLAAEAERRKSGSGTAFLTFLGGGAFGNDPRWIRDAMLTAAEKAAHHPLDVRVVCRHAVPQWLLY